MVDQESAHPLAKGAAAKAKHTPAPGCEKVARAITGDDPPAWLVEFLKKWGACLAVDRGVAAKLPTRAHMRKTLEGVRAAAAPILSALDDGETRGFLDAASPGTIPDRLAICRLTSDLARRAEEGVSWLVTEDVIAQRGQKSRRLPVTERRVGDEPLASFTSPVAGRHVGRGPGLVDKNKPLRVKAFLHLAPGGAGVLDIRAFLLGGMQ